MFLIQNQDRLTTSFTILNPYPYAPLAIRCAAHGDIPLFAGTRVERSGTTHRMPKSAPRPSAPIVATAIVGLFYAVLLCRQLRRPSKMSVPETNAMRSNTSYPTVGGAISAVKPTALGGSIARIPTPASPKHHVDMSLVDNVKLLVSSRGGSPWRGR